MRATSDKSLRLVLSTFKNLREELCHLQDDLGVSPALPSHGSSRCSQLAAGARAGTPGCGCAGGSGGWMDTGGFGSSRDSLSHPSPGAVGEGSTQFLLGKQQRFPHQPSIVLENEKLREKEFELEHRTRSLCTGLSFGVFFWFVWGFLLAST